MFTIAFSAVFLVFFLGPGLIVAGFLIEKSALPGDHKTAIQGCQIGINGAFCLIFSMLILPVVPVILQIFSF